jgi:hypothetical protein
MSEERIWNEITPEAKQWLRGWYAVMDKNLAKRIVWHTDISDDDVFYFKLPSSLTFEQLKLTNVNPNWPSQVAPTKDE